MVRNVSGTLSILDLLYQTPETPQNQTCASKIKHLKVLQLGSTTVFSWSKLDSLNVMVYLIFNELTGQVNSCLMLIFTCIINQLLSSPFYFSFFELIYQVYEYVFVHE